MGLGVVAGLLALLFIETLTLSERLFRQSRIAPILRPAAGATLLLALTPLAGPSYLGLSSGLLDRALAGDPIAPAGFLWKMVFTAITLGSGGSGGVLTPIFVIGATAGRAISGALSLDPRLAAVLGMVGLLSGAANTPLAATAMATELFGAAVGVPAAAVAVVSFLVAGHRSVYPSQILAMRKAEGIRVRTDVPVNHAEPTCSLTLVGWVALARRWTRVLGPGRGN